MSQGRIAEHAQKIIPGIARGKAGAVHALRADASSRRYYRVDVEGGAIGSVVIMELPGSTVSEEAEKVSEQTELPFVDIGGFLARGGLPVPALYHYDRPAGLLYLEDLGDVTMEQAVLGSTSQQRRAYYLRAIDVLTALQAYGDGQREGCLAYARRFDVDLLRWELDHFREWLLEVDRGHRLGASQGRVLSSEFDRLARLLADAPTTFVHRDFQSRNLMVQGSRLRLVDFQDALIGPIAYDLVGLLRDSYVVLGQDEVDSLVFDYLTMRPFSAGSDAFLRWFDLQTVQRKLKDAGRFIYIDRVKKNPSFLPYVRPSLAYVREAMGRLPDFSALGVVLRDLLPEFND